MGLLAGKGRLLLLASIVLPSPEALHMYRVLNPLDHPVIAMEEWSWWDQNLDCNERARKVRSQLPIQPSIWQIAVDAESEERKLSKDIKRGHEFAASEREFADSDSQTIQTQASALWIESSFV